MAQSPKTLARGESTAIRVGWSPVTTPWTAVIRFARRKPLGAVGGFIVLALVVQALRLTNGKA